MTALEIAQSFLARGWIPVPVPFREKGPKMRGWQRFTPTREDLEKVFDGEPQNVGVLLGERSGGLVDIDLDCVEALRLAPLVLTPTRAFGRASKPRSHLLYQCLPCPDHTVKYQDSQSKDHATLVELRSTGGQTVFPGSTHPSGESIEWADDRPVENVDGDELSDLVARLAAAALLVRYWPKGARQDAARALGGGLLRSGWADERVAWFVRIVAEAAGDEEVERRVATVAATSVKLADGKSVEGWPALSKRVGQPVVTAIRQWLGVATSGVSVGTGTDARPKVIITPELHEVVDGASNALADDPEVYQRDGQLVHVVRVADAEADREHAPPGTPQIRLAPTPHIRERLTRSARFVRLRRTEDGEAEIATIPPDSVLSALMTRGQWNGMRVLSGVCEAPSLRPDGTLLDVPGYDAATGYLYFPGDNFEQVDESPSQDQCNAALCALCEPWAEFDWATDSDRYVPAAAVLSLLARPAIQGAVPMFVFDKSVRGAGGTLTTDAIAMLATGRGAPRMTWPGKDEETEKALGAYALRGARIICFDNCTGVLGGAPLDKVLTAQGTVELRVLGRSEVPTLTWRSVVLASGNNVTLAGDTSRRVLLARMEPQVERPEERTGFSHPDLLAWLTTERPRLVRAALTVLRGYVVAGKPDQHLRPWGSFERWTDLVPSAIHWAGGADVMPCRPTIAGLDDAETAALRAVLENWGRLAPTGLTLKTAIGSLYPRERIRGEAVEPDGFDELREGLEALAPPRPGMAPDAHKLGVALRRHVGRIVGGRRLRHSQGHGGLAIWRVDERGSL